MQALKSNRLCAGTEEGNGNEMPIEVIGTVHRKCHLRKPREKSYNLSVWPKYYKASLHAKSQDLAHFLQELPIKSKMNQSFYFEGIFNSDAISLLNSF